MGSAEEGFVKFQIRCSVCRKEQDPSMVAQILGEGTLPSFFPVVI
jgi:hypothetical protein